MSATRSLIAPSANPLLERALQEKLQRRSGAVGSLGELEPLALRLGLMMNTLKPRFLDPQLVVFAADHGIAVEGLAAPGQPTTPQQVEQLLAGRWPMAVYARTQGIRMAVVDCGIAADMPAHERLLMRKIAHGTRNPRVGAAMTVDQAHAAMRAGMEIGDSLRGNVLICAGLGVGGDESAALVLSRLCDVPVRELAGDPRRMSAEQMMHLGGVMHAAQSRHRNVVDPVEVLAAFGGFDMAVMVGAMLVAASKRQLLLIDGLPACAALMTASRIAKPVTDYCVFCRSHSHRGLTRALALFRASALLELGLECADGTGATLSWPLVRSAAALLTEVAEGEDPGPTRPAAMAAAAEGEADAAAAGAAAAGLGDAAASSDRDENDADRAMASKGDAGQEPAPAMERSEIEAADAEPPRDAASEDPAAAVPAVCADAGFGDDGGKDDAGDADGLEQTEQDEQDEQDEQTEQTEQTQQTQQTEQTRQTKQTRQTRQSKQTRHSKQAEHAEDAGDARPADRRHDAPIGEA